MKKSILLCALLLVTVGLQAQTQYTGDLLGSHNMAYGGTSPTTGGLPPCQFCHAPHSGIHGAPALWGQKLSTTTYTLYDSTTLVNKEQQPMPGSSSNLCLSCHDGTVAPGQTTPYGSIKMSGSMQSQDVFGTTLQTVHPFNFKLGANNLLQQADTLLPSLYTNGKTANPAVKLVDNNVQCISCHEPHVQNIDPVAQSFLVMDNSQSALCLACHVSPVGSIPGGTMNAQTAALARARSALMMPQSKLAPSNSLAQQAGSTFTGKINRVKAFEVWPESAHAVSSHRVSRTAKLGPYGNMRQNACLSCHAPHNASGSALLSTSTKAPANTDPATANCISCHSGDSTITPAISNIYAEILKSGHPLPNDSNKHESKEDAVLNKNRHATCVDCHDPHSSSSATAFTTTIRGPQKGAPGISASDGTTIVNPAANQYETCLRCHGTSVGKQILGRFGYLPTRASASGDPLNLIPQFTTTGKSSHPVMHDRNSALSQPSLLKFMLNLDGRTPGRPMGARVLCTDCHNSDDNREFGGTGPTGPHGSKYSHILERRYEFSQVAPANGAGGGPGSAIQNLLPPIIDPAADGPYSLCAKCHDLGNVLSNASFAKHSSHINAGLSCSVCHSSHGVPEGVPGIPGDRLISFDLAVVGQNDASNVPISYNHAANTCTLKCHNMNHNADGSVQPSSNRQLSRVGAARTSR